MDVIITVYSINSGKGTEGRVNELNWMQQPNYVINTFPLRAGHIGSDIHNRATLPNSFCAFFAPTQHRDALHQVQSTFYF